MTDFHEILFPVDISFGSTGGPKFKTAIFQADSGYEARVSDWTLTRAEYDVSNSIKFQDQMDRLTAFFFDRRGRAYGFRFKDWNDYLVTDVSLGFGDYAVTDFQMVKHYDSAGPDAQNHRYTRPLKKLAWGTEGNITVDGLAITRTITDLQFYAINYYTGTISTGVPMRGGLYAGTTPSTVIDFITTGEGGHATGFNSRSVNGGGPPYDPVRGVCYLLGTFNIAGLGNGQGLRVINVDTAAETTQKTSAAMGIVDGTGGVTTLSSIIAVSPVDGAIFATAGGSSNGQPIVKIDPDTLTKVAQFGVTNTSPGASSIALSGPPGCVSLDGANLLCLPSNGLGSVVYHHTSDLVRGGTIQAGVATCGCPYKQTGFAVLNHLGAAATPLKLLLMPTPGAVVEAMQFGGVNAVGLWMLYDRATGGLLIGWRETSTEFWCGLYHSDVQGFRWKRRMPEMLGSDGTVPDPQTPLQGQMAWLLNATSFGPRLWLLDTATGVVTARVSNNTFGSGQTFAPDRRIVITAGSGAGAIYATDLTGVTFAGPEELVVGTCEFHVPVRFDTDHLNSKHEFWMTQSWDQIPLVEVRDWNDVDLD